MKLKNRKVTLGVKKGIFCFASFMLISLPSIAEPCSEHNATTAEQTQATQKGVCWMRASHAGKNTAGYFYACPMTFKDPDKLLKAESDIAKIVELHDHINDNGIMKMRPIEFVEIKEGSAGMKPGGKHIMIMGLKKDLKAGDKVMMTLHFEKAGIKQILFEVR